MAQEKIDNSFNPHINPDAISIIKQKDGNYKAYGQKFGKVIEVRGISPETVLALLLISDGKNTI